MTFATHSAFNLTGISQEGRLLELKTPLTEPLLAVRVHGVERLGRIPRYCVDVVSESTRLDPHQVIGEPVRLAIKRADGSHSYKHGFVGSVRYLGSDGSLQDWQLEFAPWFSLLEYRQDCRIWQDMTMIDIFTDVFRGHPQAQGRYEFNLRHEHPPQSYVTQFNESDAHFVQRWCEQAGIYWYVVHEADQHRIVFVDSVLDLPPLEPEALPFHTQTAALDHDSIVEWSQADTLLNGHVLWSSNNYRAHRQPLSARSMGLNPPSAAKTLERYEYRGQYAWHSEDDGNWQTRVQIEQVESAARRITGHGGVRHMLPGNGFELRGHPLYEDGPAKRRTFLLIAVEFFAQSNLPVALTRRERPGSLQSRLKELGADKPSEKGEGFYCNAFEAQRQDVPYRSAFEHDKPLNPGPQTAAVVAPNGGPVQTDVLNRVCVRFHWDRLRSPEKAPSCWLRMLQNSSGAGWGSVYVPRAGEEVVVTFLDNDIDRPLILGQVYGGDKPAWHSTGRMSGYKSQEIDGLGYNHWVMDDTTAQLRTQIHSSHGHSQLNLGCLVDQQGNHRGAWRGDGFELRTDASGAIRAPQGLYLSTWRRTKAQSGHLDSSEAGQQLSDALQRVTALSDSAGQHNALSLEEGLENLNRLHQAATHSLRQGNATSQGYDAPLIVASAPADIAAVTPENIQLHSGRHTSLSSGEDINLASARSLLVSVGRSISLFARDAGAKLFAAKGKVEIQAQDDAIELTAKDSVRITSTARTIEIAAQEEILLTCGGAFIRLKNGDIQIHAPGTIDIKAAKKTIGNASQMDREQTPWPQSTAGQTLTLLAGQSSAASHQPWTGMPYTVFADGVEIEKGVMSRDGKISVEHRVSRSRYRVELANGASYDIPVSGDYLGDQDNGARANRGLHRHQHSLTPGSGEAPSQYREDYDRLNHPDTEA
ncbi:type VI secretion system Vgr family protein [Pseudomonas sp. PS02290]|uniref:type VI secretion system Vgr family protein n=1 Tax=Pseudomonas sp. PS02290 TaxID=2991430 RepID=UPI00249AA2FB|nr:type VI secretion system Vgr family protein [Pseudomonas sp. PS02290]